MNFAKWKANIKMILGIMDWNHSLYENKPVELVAEDDNDITPVLRKDD
jgi:hypothetical protein